MSFQRRSGAQDMIVIETLYASINFMFDMQKVGCYSYRFDVLYLMRLPLDGARDLLRPIDVVDGDDHLSNGDSWR